MGHKKLSIKKLSQLNLTELHSLLTMVNDGTVYGIHTDLLAQDVRYEEEYTEVVNITNDIKSVIRNKVHELEVSSNTVGEELQSVYNKLNKYYGSGDFFNDDNCREYVHNIISAIPGIENVECDDSSVNVARGILVATAYWDGKYCDMVFGGKIPTIVALHTHDIVI